MPLMATTMTTMNRLFVLALAVLAALLLAVLGNQWFLPVSEIRAGDSSRRGQDRAASAAPDSQTATLPWAARTLEDGTLAVFDLALGRDTLAQAQQRFGEVLQLALVARVGEVGVLEALVEPFSAGFVTGRLVLSFDVPSPILQAWREHTLRSEPMDGGLRRFALTATDRQSALAMPVSGVSFVPSVKLSRNDVEQRFGAAAQSITVSNDSLVLLYPGRALAITVAASTTQRAVMQYVVPAHFESRLRQPMLAAGTAHAPGTSAAASSTAPSSAAAGP